MHLRKGVEITNKQNKTKKGSAEAAKDVKLLKKYNISHIVAIGYNLEKFHENDFHYLLINRVEDSFVFL